MTTKPLNAGEVVQGYTFTSNWPDIGNGLGLIAWADMPNIRTVDPRYTEIAILTRDHYESLLAEVERHRNGTAALAQVQAFADDNVRLTAENADLRTRLAEAERKVEAMAQNDVRYRWLRDKSAAHHAPAPTATLANGFGIKVMYEPAGDPQSRPNFRMSGADLDAMLDAEILAQKEQGNG